MRAATEGGPYKKLIRRGALRGGPSSVYRRGRASSGRDPRDTPPPLRGELR